MSALQPAVWEGRPGGEAVGPVIRRRPGAKSRPHMKLFWPIMTGYIGARQAWHVSQSAISSTVPASCLKWKEASGRFIREELWEADCVMQL